MKPTDNTLYIDPKSIQIVSDKNPRTRKNDGWSPEKMERLRQNIAKDGLNHAIQVRPLEDGHRLIAGERRLRSILSLLEEDAKLQKEGKEPLLCKNPRNTKMEPATTVYKTVECKVLDCSNDRDALRRAIAENVLHENLSDHELLSLVKDLQNQGFSRTEQAEIMDNSEAWISQSHTLLECHEMILEAMENGILSRTAAITFIPIPRDKVVAVLKKAIDLTYRKAEEKEEEAIAEIKVAKKEIEDARSLAELSDYTGNKEAGRKAKRTISRAGKVINKAEKKIEGAKQKKQKKITVETITEAAKEIEGASDDLKKTVTMKQVRVIRKSMDNLLKREGPLVHPETQEQYDRKDVALLHKFCGYMLNEVKVNNVLDLLDSVKPGKKK
jgi:ParB-like chromosome segregation protein Spo0J